MLLKHRDMIWDTQYVGNDETKLWDMLRYYPIKWIEAHPEQAMMGYVVGILN